jgi:SAM-dependent methyltransferase
MSYSADYFTARESWRDWRIEARKLIAMARVSKGTRVLEIGCGGGGLLRLLRERGACAVGVDTLEVALKLARERLDADERRPTRMKDVLSRALKGRSNFQDSRQTWQESLFITSNKPPRSSAAIRVQLIRIGEEGALPFRDAAFDAIVGQHVIEHLPDADAALREWKRLLKPDGRLALATPNAGYPDPAHFADADHARVFSPRELADAAARAGFAVEACHTLFPFLTRVRALHALGVIGYRAFQHAPYFNARGRTILLSARKC